MSSFKQSNYITDFWNWFMTLMSKAAEMVLFGHAIYALREEYGESTITVHEASELQQCIDELSSKLVRVQQDFHHQLSSELAPVHESFQQYQEALSQVPMLKAHLQHIESSTVEEVERVKAFLEKQLQGYLAECEKRTERPALHALPPVQQGNYETGTLHTKQVRPRASQAAAGKFDARAFVFACLQEHPDLKLAEIEQRARAAAIASSFCAGMKALLSGIYLSYEEMDTRMQPSDKEGALARRKLRRLNGGS